MVSTGDSGRVCLWRRAVSGEWKEFADLGVEMEGDGGGEDGGEGERERDRDREGREGVIGD